MHQPHQVNFLTVKIYLANKRMLILIVNLLSFYFRLIDLYEHKNETINDKMQNNNIEIQSSHLINPRGLNYLFK